MCKNLIFNLCCYFLIREPAEELLHRLRVLEKRDAFVVIADTLEIGPIQFAPLVRGDIRVRFSLAVLASRV